MRKKNYMAITFILAGAMVIGGAGALAGQMSSDKAKTVVVRAANTSGQVDAVTEDEGMEEAGTADAEEQKEERADARDEEKSAEKEDTADIKEPDSGKKILQEGKGIYLPQGAVLEGEDALGYTISWNGYHITYYKPDEESTFVKEKEEDMSIGKAIEIAEEAVAAYGKKDISGADITIYLQKYGSEADKENVDNDKNYGIRCYSLHIEGVEEHVYSMEINSITGNILDYDDFYLVGDTKEERIEHEVLFDGYMETELGYGAGKNASDEEIHAYYDKKIQEAEKVYAPIGKSFVQDTLKMGKVTKCFGFIAGEMGAGSCSRFTLSFYCQTENNDIIEVTVDQINKTVQGFAINPLIY